MPPTSYNDEALARALQIEYEREYRRRSMQQHINTDVATTGHNDNRNGRQHHRNTSASAPVLPPPPIIIPSAPYEFSNDVDDRAQHNNVIGSHRGIATNQSSIPPSSFIMAEDAFGGGTNVELSDAAYARQLELEMREEERRQRKHHLQKQRDSYRASVGSTSRETNNIARTSTNVVVPNSRIPSTTRAANINQSDVPSESYSSPNRRNPSTRPSSNYRNETLPAYISPANHQQRNSAPPSNTNVTQGSGRDSNHRSSNDMPGYVPAVTGMSAHYTDEEIARRLEQEMLDEELARRAFYEEQIRQSSIAAQSIHNDSTNRRGNGTTSGRSSGCRRCMRCVIMLTIIGAAAGLCIYFFGGVQNVGDFIPDLDQFKEEDPFNNANIEDANLWRTRDKAGLELTVVNALEERWDTYFTTAISQWDAGSPDTLTLTVEDATPDSTCTAIDGKLKVCNGNYGATNWRGINKILLENGWIYSSAARMNEYYVTDNDDDQRQYTMCHEIGHGFGLPHTDENFFNKDLGNCMDYTNNPSTNMQPAYANFKFLAKLYGTVDGSPVPTDDAVASTNTQAVEEKETEKEDGNQTDTENPDGNRRRLLPSHIARQLAEIDADVDSGEYRTKFRLLHESSHGHTAHELDLGDGYTVRILALNA